MDDIFERKWNGLVERQDMSLEEQEHQRWVKEQIIIDPDFIEKSEDIEIPPKKFKYIPQRVNNVNSEEVSVRVNYKLKGYSTSVAPSQKDPNNSVDQSSNDAKR